ncbi:MAG: hypothetical protein RLZZ608_25, partial [Actinomycetota bacterium]
MNTHTITAPATATSRYDLDPDLSRQLWEAEIAALDPARTALEAELDS